MRQGSFCFERTLFQGLNVRVQCLPTCSLFTGECQVIVAGHVVPLPSFMPDHHHAILSWLEETVGLVWPPVVELLWKNTLSFHVWVLRCWSNIIKNQATAAGTQLSWWMSEALILKLLLFKAHHRLHFTEKTEGGATETPRGKQTAGNPLTRCFSLHLNKTTGSRIKH